MNTNQPVITPHLQVHTTALFNEFQRYFSELRLYFHLYGQIPSVLIAYGKDTERALSFVRQQFEDRIEQHFFRRDQKEDENNSKFWIEIFQLNNEMLVSFESSGEVSLFFPSRQAEEAEALFNTLLHESTAKPPQGECQVHMIAIKRDALGLEKLSLPSGKVRLRQHYVPEVTDLFHYLRRLLRKPQQSGLIMLHGAPGTGKTTFIQYLLARQPRKVLILSPDMAKEMDKPSMAKLLFENKGALIVLEDAEELVVSREQSRSNAIATLLNISDGLMGRGLGIIIITTFNAPVKSIDPALLRKGRLLAIYEFKALPAAQASALLKRRGYKGNAETPMTLADIFSFEIDSFQYKKTSASEIGFRVTATV